MNPDLYEPVMRHCLMSPTDSKDANSAAAAGVAAATAETNTLRRHIDKCSADVSNVSLVAGNKNSPCSCNDKK